MSDLRFKISGNTEPYIAEIYRVCDNTFICKKLMEYSGFETLDECNYSCVIFSGLEESQCYCLNLCDNVGNICKSGIVYQTPANPEYIPLNVNVNLEGTVCNFSTYATLSEPKKITITPTLSVGQCIDMVLSATLLRTCCNDAVSIEIYKKCTASGTYNLYCDVGLTALSPINISMGNGDCVCYNMSSSYCCGNSCAILNLSGATLSGSFNVGCDVLTCGPQTCISLLPPVTTTTTTFATTTTTTTASTTTTTTTASTTTTTTTT